MSKKKHPRTQAEKSSGGQKRPTQAAKLGDQTVFVENTASAEVLGSYSRSDRKKSEAPKRVVLVRYSHGKDNLLVEDAVSKEIVTLTPGDNRKVHMNTSLMHKLLSQGFEFEIEA